MPLVFTQNEVNLSDDSYADVLGEQYEYPRNYLGLIRTGERFVYYRGGRRKKGARQTPVYFGVGTVGKVSQVNNDLFRCTVDNFAAFKQPVPFKDAAGLYLETEANSRKAIGFYFQPGVRRLSEDDYLKILRAGT